MLFDIKEDGKAYPFSHDAKSVVELLLMNAEIHDVEMIYNQKITELTKEDTFTLKSDSDAFDGFDRVVLATGSVAAQQLGGNDSGYIMAQSCGHTITPLYPSLVQLELAGDLYKPMSGVKKYSEVTLFVDKQVEATVAGDALFTNYGISGLAILDLSQKASFALTLGSEVTIGVNLLPEFDRQKLDSQIQALCKQVPEASLHTLLSGMIHTKIVMNVLKVLNIPVDIKAKESDNKLIKKIVNQLINWKFNVTQTHGFKYAEVSGGGVLTNEVNAKTMESLKEPGLYIVGEVLDVVGDRGGYNFHFAWATAHCAAQAIIATL
jgi:predicted Rossmann fold flavoprotein